LTFACLLSWGKTPHTPRASFARACIWFSSLSNCNNRKRLRVRFSSLRQLYPTVRLIMWFHLENYVVFLMMTINDDSISPCIHVIYSMPLLTNPAWISASRWEVLYIRRYTSGSLLSVGVTWFPRTELKDSRLWAEKCFFFRWNSFRVTARRAKRESGGLGEDPPGSTMTY
jgi:hypothetical protein